MKNLLTGFTELDKIIGNTPRGSIVIIGGRPAMGKTAFMLDLVINTARIQKSKNIYINLSEKAQTTINRMLSSISEVEIDKISSELYTGIEFQRLFAANRELEELNIEFCDEWENIDTIKDSIVKKHKESKLDYIFFDYLQLIPEKSSYEEMMNILLILKRLAMETDTIIFLNSQLSREVEKRYGHRPLLSDLRDCGGIEEIASVVLFLLRREYYDPQDKPGMAEIIIEKNSYGKTGKVDLAFRKEFMQFANYTPLRYNELSNSDADFQQFSPE